MNIKVHEFSEDFRAYLVFLYLAISGFTFGSEPVVVTERAIRVVSLGREEMYFGFAKGDEIVLSLHTNKQKLLGQIELKEHDGDVLYSDLKVFSINEKRIKIPNTGIYKLSLDNPSLGKRICDLMIKRIPERERTQEFNTTVYWRDIQDTNYYEVTEWALLSSDTTFNVITDQIEKVHSSLNLNGNRNTFGFTLPENCVAWSYYIGVDQAGQGAYEEATRELAEHSSPILSQIPGYGPLGALALGAASYLTILQRGEDIDFWIIDQENISQYQNGEMFYSLKGGKVINAFSQMLSPLFGRFYFCLRNDNAIDGVSVAVKVTAVCVKENWGFKKVKKYRVVKAKKPYIEEYEFN